MKSQRSGISERGSVTVAVLVTVLIVAVFATAFMENVGHDFRRTSAFERSVRAIYLAQAGANHATADLVGPGTGALGTQALPVSFGGGAYWSEVTDNGDGSFTILAYGRLGEQVRAYEVVLAPEQIPLFTKALFGDLDLGASGTVFTDSYDSDLGSYASQAVNVDPLSGMTYAQQNGSLGSNANITIDGTVTVLGDATPGPGGSVIVSGGSAYIAGSTAPAVTTTPFPPIEFNPSGTSAGNFSTTGSVTFTAGEYHYTDFEGKANADIRFQGDVVLFVDGALSLAGQAKITIDPGATLTIYHSGDDISLTGGGVLNSTEEPEALKIFSNGSTVKFGGKSAFYGAIYAPNGSIDPGGTPNIYGSFVGKSIQINGTAAFHYDEALGKAPDSTTILRTVSWRPVSTADIN
jgi:hypothetical protein